MSCCRPELCCRDHSLCGGSGLSSASPLRVYDQNRQVPGTSDGPSAMAPLSYEGPQDSGAFDPGSFEARNQSCVVPCFYPLLPTIFESGSLELLCLPLPKKRPIASKLQRSKWPLAAPWSGHTELPLTFQPQGASTFLNWEDMDVSPR